MKLSQSIRISSLILFAFVLTCSASIPAQAPATPPTPGTATAVPAPSAPSPATTAAPAPGKTEATTKPTTPPPSRLRRVTFLAGAAAITLFLYCLLCNWHPLQLIVGQDNRYSNSKFQVMLWFFVLITTYIATFTLRICSGVEGSIDIPTNLLLLSGMSTFTYGAAKGITTSKVNDAQAQGVPDPKTPAAAPSFLLDLTHDDGSPATTGIASDGTPLLIAAKKPSLDMGDTQMVMVTLLAVVSYLYAVVHFMGGPRLTEATTYMPDVDTTILSIFGLGQGAYITKKAVGNIAQT